MADLDELLKRCAARTKGKWKAFHRCHGAKPTDDEISGLGWDIDGMPRATNRGVFERAADAHFFEAAVNDLEPLIRELQAARAEAKEANKLVEQATHEYTALESQHYDLREELARVLAVMDSYRVWRITGDIWIIKGDSPPLPDPSKLYKVAVGKESDSVHATLRAALARAEELKGGGG